MPTSPLKIMTANQMQYIIIPGKIWLRFFYCFIFL